MKDESSQSIGGGSFSSNRDGFARKRAHPPIRTLSLDFETGVHPSVTRRVLMQVWRQAMDNDVAVEANLAEQTDILVNKTAHFVGEWIQDHATDAPTELPAHIAAEALANECIADAERRGILPDEINDEVGDLKAYLTETVLNVDQLPTSQNG